MTSLDLIKFLKKAVSSSDIGDLEIILIEGFVFLSFFSWGLGWAFIGGG